MKSELLKKGLSFSEEIFITYEIGGEGGGFVGPVLMPPGTVLTQTD